MALTSIIRDFAVRAGLIVEGTASVTSATGMTGTLQVNGGAAIAKNLIVGESSDTKGDGFVRSNFTVEGAAYLAGTTASGILTVSTNTQATTGGNGALKVTGGGYFGSNVVVNSIAASTQTVASNSLYVAGGLGVDGSLVVRGEAVFQNDVIFTGVTTYVYSTDTVYTDNLIELHSPTETTSSWAVDDGKDIGIIYNYYNGADQNAFLGLANDTKYLEWYDTGVETAGTGTFVNATYGTFKTGSIKLTNQTSATSTTTGALQVAGGIGAETVYATNARIGSLTQNRIVIAGPNGQLLDDAGLFYDFNTDTLNATISNANTATDLAGGTSGAIVYQGQPGDTSFLPIGTAGLVLLTNGSTPYWGSIAGSSVGAANTASNLEYGFQYAVPYQTGAGSTAFEENFKYNYDSNTLITVNASFTGTTDSSGLASGAVQILGGASITKNLYVGGTIYGAILGAATSATYVTTVADLGSTTRYLTFVDSNNGSADYEQLYTTSTVSFNPNSGNLTIAGQLLSSSVTSGAINGTSLATTGTLSVSGQATMGVTTVTSLTAESATISGAVLLTSPVDSSSTNSGALQVVGGVGVGGNVYAGGNAVITGNVAVNGGSLTTTQSSFNLINTGATVVNFAGAGTAITIGATSGYTDIRNQVRATITTDSNATNTGAVIVSGGVGVGGNVYAGGNVVVTGDVAANGGNLTTTAETFNLVNANATTVNIAGASTATTISSTTGYTQIRNQTTITDTTAATSAVTGALQVRGGVGISGAIWINQTLKVNGASTLANVNAAVTTATTLTVTGAATVGGTLSATDSQNSNAPTNGAVRVTGGVGVIKDVTVGGAITAGVTAAVTTATVVPALYSNNFLQSSYTSGVIAGITQVDLDSFSASVYRSARYFCQIVDGSDVHISEISLFHDGVKAYINEYGIATNHGQLGTFDAELTGGNVLVRFTPTNATAMTIKLFRVAITL